MIKECKNCKRIDRMYAKGMCMSCYNKQYLKDNPEKYEKTKARIRNNYKKKQGF